MAATVNPYFSPPVQAWETVLKPMIVAGTPEQQDYAAAYIRGDFHGKVVLHGAECSDCGFRIETVQSRTQFPGPDGTPLTRERTLPIEVTWEQASGGMSCTECGGQCRLDYTTGPEGGPVLSYLKEA